MVQIPARGTINNNNNNISELGRRICVHTGDVRDFMLIPTHFYHATALQLRAFARHSAS